jgi:hypothetical protein
MALIPLNTFKTKAAVLTTEKYNQARCARDTALIIESIVVDMLQSDTSQTTFAGLQYWAQAAIKIPGEVTQTLAALEYAKQVALQLIMNTTVTRTINNPDYAARQDTTSYPASTSVGQRRVAEEFDLIISIIEHGTAGTTDMIVSNANLISDVNLLNAANILDINSVFLQQEVTAWIDKTFAALSGGYTYNPVKCERDTKLIVDSLAFDILTNGNTQSMFAGLQYWAQGSTTVPSEQPQTLAALSQLAIIVGQIILSTPIAVSATNTLTQVFDSRNKSNKTTKLLIDANFSIISEIINIGTTGVSIPGDKPGEQLTRSIVPNSVLSTETAVLNAYQLIEQNKVFIQTEIIAWIEQQVLDAIDGSIWYLFDYNATTILGTAGDVILVTENNIGLITESVLDASINSDKCFRDVGYILDCVSFDLLYSGNRQSIQAGSYYYGYSSTTITIPNEVPESIAAYNYLKSLIGDVITAQAIAEVYQIDLSQVVDMPQGTNVESSKAELNIQLITDIIELGPTITPAKTPISLAYQPTQAESNAAALLLANRDFLAASVSAYINNILAPGFKYNAATCRRDIGFIVACMTFDIRHTGNRQATQAGVYYYSNSATISIVPTESIDTVGAYAYMGYVLACVVNHKQLVSSNTYLTAPYQHTALQTGTLLVPESHVTVVNNINGLIASLNALILGPLPVSEPEKKPVKPTTTSDTTFINAAAIIRANKSFIVAEVIGFMNALQTPNTTKIYTAPPGITAIILMAQVSNVTDHPINVTFAYYRNFPVTADPATLNGFQAGNSITYLVKDYSIPPYDSSAMLDGKMIIESFDSIVAYASESQGLNITLSVLETANS